MVQDAHSVAMVIERMMMLNLASCKRSPVRAMLLLRGSFFSEDVTEDLEQQLADSRISTPVFCLFGESTTTY